MEKTIFQKIIDREIPATIVYEDDTMLAFLDIRPVSYGHTLLISKEPYVWMQDVPDELLAKMFVQTKKMMVAMKEALEADFIQISVMGKDVPHFHIHLMPRKFDDGLHGYPTLEYKDTAEMQTYADKIKSRL